MDVGGIHGIGSRKNSGFHYWRTGSTCYMHMLDNLLVTTTPNLLPIFSPYLGGNSNGKRGIRLVHGVTKSTLITYFSGMKIDPKYTFLHAFFS